MNYPRWRVIELVDPRDPLLPRAVFACRVNDSPWCAVWEHRDKVQSKLAIWFRELSAANLQPLEQTLLGHICAMPERTAHAVCRFRISEIARMSGCTAGELPGFLCHDEKHVGGQGDRRPCTVIKNNRVNHFNSVADAARFLGIQRATVSRAVVEGRRCGGGAIVV